MKVGAWELTEQYLPCPSGWACGYSTPDWPTHFTALRLWEDLSPMLKIEQVLAYEVGTVKDCLAGGKC